MYIKKELPRRLLVGLSGGADSVALALLLMKENVQLTAVHVNHGLRGAASDGDEAFVRQLCQQWGLPLMVYRATPPEHPGEDWARQARYGFFRQAIEQTGAQAIALAHHRDDQAETLLLHLLRGSGLTGLTGMAEDGHVLGVRVIRPLLHLSRQELRQVLREADLPWREDDSNQDETYLRNAVRHQLLPLMEQLAPGAAVRLAATAEVLMQDEITLHAAAKTFLQKHTGPYLPVEELATLPLGMRRRVLRMWWDAAMPHEQTQRGLDRPQTEALAALVEAPAGSQCNLPGDRHAYRGWTHIHLLGGAYALPQVTAQVTDGADACGDGKQSQALPRNVLMACEVRTRQTSDWIRPFGQKGSQSLQDYFINRRVDAPFRDHVPLLCRGREVLLAAGVGAGDVPRFDPTNDNLTLRFAGSMPWAQTKKEKEHGT